MARANFKDHTGEQFGILTVIQRYPENDDSGGARWVCECGCGNTRVIDGHALRRGDYQSCGCKRLEYLSLPKGVAMMNAIFRNYVKSATKRGYEFELSQEEFNELISQDCYYCGAPPTNAWHQTHFNGTIKYNGIDRIDNEIRYVSGNCVPACKMCNRMKMDWGHDEFIKKAIAIAEKHGGEE